MYNNGSHRADRFSALRPSIRLSSYPRAGHVSVVRISSELNSVAEARRSLACYLDAEGDRSENEEFSNPKRSQLW